MIPKEMPSVSAKKDIGYKTNNQQWEGDIREYRGIDEVDIGITGQQPVRTTR